MKNPTCYKIPEKPSCIDLFLSNRPKSFLGTHVLETGLSDFSKMTLTKKKIYIRKQDPRKSNLQIFEIVNNILNIHGPVKKG